MVLITWVFLLSLTIGSSFQHQAGLTEQGSLSRHVQKRSPKNSFGRGGRKYVIDGKEVSLDLIPARGDGACLFNTLSMALYGTEDMSQTVREDVVDHVLSHYDHYGGFLVNSEGNMSPEEYSRYMRKPRVYGTIVEVNAASELYKRRIIVFRGDSVYCDVGLPEWPLVLSAFSGNQDSGHFDLLVPSD